MCRVWVVFFVWVVSFVFCFVFCIVFLVCFVVYFTVLIDILNCYYEYFRMNCILVVYAPTYYFPPRSQSQVRGAPSRELDMELVETMPVFTDFLAKFYSN